MERVPEPELMDEAEQARAYAAADFSEPHQAFVDHFRARFPDHVPHTALDLGCGPCDVTTRFARAYPGCRLTAIDGAAAMLAEARTALQDAGVAERVRLLQRRLPDLAGLAPGFDTIISNSLLHHLHDPDVLWRSIRLLAAPGAAVQVMDLLRPGSARQLKGLVALHAQGAPEVLRRDFANSLRAAFRVDEIRAQLAAARLALTVEVVSDRHVLVSGRLA
jgi:trans-aconitate methyltransferase